MKIQLLIIEVINFAPNTGHAWVNLDLWILIDVVPKEQSIFLVFKAKQ